MKHMKTSPKDIFLHLLAIIALYASAISFLTLAFQYANLAFPDTLEYSYAIDAAYSRIRMAISFLIIAFPVYLFVMRFFEKDYKKNPEKRKLTVRKWLIYFTLFVAALVILGDLIALINNFLEGDLTVRFAIKVVAVLFVAGSIFGYYLSDIKRHKLE